MYILCVYGPSACNKTDNDDDDYLDVVTIWVSLFWPTRYSCVLSFESCTRCN